VEEAIEEVEEKVKQNSNTTTPPVGGLGSPKKAGSTTIKVPLETEPKRKLPTPRF